MRSLQSSPENSLSDRSRLPTTRVPTVSTGYQSSCIHREFITRAQAPVLRVPLADGTLVPTPGMPSDGLIPSLLTISDALSTGWFAADAANVKPLLDTRWSSTAAKRCSDVRGEPRQHRGCDSIFAQDRDRWRTITRAVTWSVADGLGELQLLILQKTIRKPYGRKSLLY